MTRRGRRETLLPLGASGIGSRDPGFPHEALFLAEIGQAAGRGVQLGGVTTGPVGAAPFRGGFEYLGCSQATAPKSSVSASWNSSANSSGRGGQGGRSSRWEGRRSARTQARGGTSPVNSVVGRGTVDGMTQLPLGDV